MAISQDLLDILVCPETRQPLTLAGDELLQRLNQRIRDGALRNRGGDAVESELAAGLVRQDGAVLYPIEDDIPVMLIEESIELSGAET
jgi:uncharacterized protein YbaR (Trm112 family)